jgi:hypothetical protein
VDCFPSIPHYICTHPYQKSAPNQSVSAGKSVCQFETPSPKHGALELLRKRYFVFASRRIKRNGSVCSKFYPTSNTFVEWTVFGFVFPGEFRGRERREGRAGLHIVKLAKKKIFFLWIKRALSHYQP